MIGISVKVKYAITAMFELSISSMSVPIGGKTIAEKHRIPQSFLEQVLTSLKKSGLIKSYRGSQGGYILAKKPSSITLNDIIISLNGDVSMCDGHKGCKILESLWQELDQKTKELFDISLEELIQRKQRSEKMLTYTI